MLTPKSLSRMAGVDARLQAVIGAAAAICPVEFVVTEGLRSQERQLMLCKAGKSRTILSKHCIGKAVDVAAIVDGKADWTWKHYETIAKAVKAAALQLDTPIEWGGDWITFKDGVHF